MGDITQIARSFTDFYYGKFDGVNGNNQRAELGALYRGGAMDSVGSMLTWEGQQFRGKDAIVEKLTGLPLQIAKRQLTTVDAQPSNPNVSSLLVNVTGLLFLDGSPNPLQFSQIFQLVPDAGTGSFWVYNDIFRLILA